ncbi:hypothetical protein ABVT39_022800 [Epinephelus coioides]
MFQPAVGASRRGTELHTQQQRLPSSKELSFALLLRWSLLMTTQHWIGKCGGRRCGRAGEASSHSDRPPPPSVEQAKVNRGRLTVSPEGFLWIVVFSSNTKLTDAVVQQAKQKLQWTPTILSIHVMLYGSSDPYSGYRLLVLVGPQVSANRAKTPKRPFSSFYRSVA